MKVSQLSIFLLVFISARPWLQHAGIHGKTEVAAAAAIGLAVVLALVAYPQLRFKPEERTLRIGADGISTTIGSRSGDITWTRVARITPGSGAVYIVGTGGNSFTVPDRAFSSAAQRDEFIALATQFLADSREPRSR